jgi:hypothetical protein
LFGLTDTAAGGTGFVLFLLLFTLVLSTVLIVIPIMYDRYVYYSTSEPRADHDEDGIKLAALRSSLRSLVHP